MKAVNLLPSDLRGAGKPASAVGASGQPPAGRTGAFAVLGVLAFGVVALAAWVLTSNTINERRAELDQVTAQAAVTAQRAAKLKPYADFAAQARERVATVTDLANGRFDWEQALRDVSRVIPADVTLTELKGTISSESGGGSPLRSAIAAPALELKGCSSKDQRAVATLMARLRTVDGVTRVSLSKSDKPDTAVVPQPGTGVAPEGCGAGRPPQFELVTFFEHDILPATLQDVTAGSAGAAGTANASTGTTQGGDAAKGNSAQSTPASTTTPTTP